MEMTMMQINLIHNEAGQALLLDGEQKRSFRGVGEQAKELLVAILNGECSDILKKVWIELKIGITFVSDGCKWSVNEEHTNNDHRAIFLYVKL